MSLVTYVGNLGVDLHRERDPAVPEDGHRDARVNVERGEERAAGAAGVVERDATDAIASAPDIEGPVDVAGFDRVTSASGEHERVLLAADARAWPVGGAGLVLVAPGDPQRGNADRGKGQRVRAAVSLEHLLVSERMSADTL